MSCFFCLKILSTLWRPWKSLKFSSEPRSVLISSQKISLIVPGLCLFPNVITNSVPFHTQNYPNLNNKSYCYLTFKSCSLAIIDLEKSEDTKEEGYSNTKGRKGWDLTSSNGGEVYVRKKTVEGQRRVCPYFLPLGVEHRGAESHGNIQRGMGSADAWEYQKYRDPLP